MAVSRTLSFGVSRHQDIPVAGWPEILCRALSAGLGSAVEPLLAQDYADLLKNVIEGKADLAWLPPLLHARAAEQGARLVAVPERSGWLTFRSALLVRKDDPVQSVQKLSGVRAAWRDKSSASGYLFPRLDIVAVGAPAEKTFSSETFYGSVKTAAEAVVRGEADLCTCYVSDAAAYDPQRANEEIARALGPLANSLRVLHVTESIPPDGFVIAPRVGDAEQRAVGEALLKMHTTEEGRTALRDVLNADRLAPVTEKLTRSLNSWAEAARRRV